MTQLTLVRRVRARPAIVFAALTTPEGIAQWWGPDAGPVLLVETDVRIEIDPKRIDTGTELTFTHARLKSEASRASHERGWAGALDKLERCFATERDAAPPLDHDPLT